MHRTDNSEFLLYIEPEKNKKSLHPLNDGLTELMMFAISRATEGAANYAALDQVANFRKESRYKGTHVTECGERSSNCDYLLENGMITNSLAPFYLQYYRDSIPDSELEKVVRCCKFYLTDKKLLEALFEYNQKQQ